MKKNKFEPLAQWYEQRFNEDARRRGYYDIFPGLKGDSNFAVIRKNIICGMHMHKKQTDFFAVAFGCVLFRLLDENGNEEKIILSEHTQKTLVIKPGIWHGYMALESSVLVFYIDHKFNPEDEFRKKTSEKDWETEIK
jgi:dTDP-4-dehydrorhamnose 3,5-epimerase-like enzyme